jgi:hypothetical protein
MVVIGQYCLGFNGKNNIEFAKQGFLIKASIFCLLLFD